VAPSGKRPFFPVFPKGPVIFFAPPGVFKKEKFSPQVRRDYTPFGEKTLLKMGPF